MNFDDRFNAAFPYMRPRGVTLTGTPVPRDPPTTYGVDPTAGQGPFRLDRGAAPPGIDPMMAVKQPVDAPLPSMVPPAQIRPPTPPAAFPVAGAAPIQSAPEPMVKSGGPSGLTLNSTPPAAGWGGSIGMPQTPEQAKTFMAGQDYQKAMAGLEEIAKGIKGKDTKSTDMNTITPMSSGGGNIGGAGMGGASGAQLLAQILAAGRKNYGA